MSYWWVNQNKTWIAEQYGEYLWAPMASETGARLGHWDSMDDVRRGDTVFHYASSAIQAVSTAVTEAFRARNPGGQDFEDWEDSGRMIRVKMQKFSQPMHRERIPANLRLGEEPFTVNATAKQGYLWPVSSQLGQWLVEQLAASPPDVADYPEEKFKGVVPDIPARYLNTGDGKKGPRSTRPSTGDVQTKAVCHTCFMERPIALLEDGVCADCR